MTLESICTIKFNKHALILQRHEVRIVLDGMRWPEGITGLCRQAGISRSTYYHYHWQRTLLEKGREGLISPRNSKTDSQRAKLIQDNQWLKELVPNLSVANLVLKKD